MVSDETTEDMVEGMGLVSALMVTWLCVDLSLDL
jgi:hypothetical protein